MLCGEAHDESLFQAQGEPAAAKLYDRAMAERITSSSNPRVKAVVKLRQHRRRRDTGRFIAEGRREITRALAAGLTPIEAFYCPALLEPETADQALAPEGAAIPVEARTEVSAAAFRKMAYLREPEGLLAVMAAPDHSLATLGPPAGDAVYLVAVGTEKPGNLGAMARTAQAAGCTAVLAAGAPVDPLNPNAIRASTGAVFSLPVVCDGESAVREWLRDHGVRLAAAIAQDAAACDRFNLGGPVAIVIGPEDAGLSEAWREAAVASGGGPVHIPMGGRGVDSLNASSAAAILLYEAVRQRRVG